MRQKVEEYSRWKPVFDENGEARRAAGSRGGQIFRNLDDPDELVILLEYDNTEKARQFGESEDLREAMERAGVTGRPDIYFLDEVEKPSV